MTNEKSKAIVRLIVLAVVQINMILTLTGHNPIPFDEVALTEWLTVGLAGIMAVWSWWKDAPITNNAQKAKDYFRSLREDGEYPIEYDDEEVRQAGDYSEDAEEREVADER